MALLLRAEEVRGLISVAEAVEAVEAGYRDLHLSKEFNIPRQRAFAGDRRLTVHSGGCVGLSAVGSFVHYERFRFSKDDQTYASPSDRVYVLYDSESAELQAIIVGSLPLFGFDTPETSFATETAITSAVGTRRLARPESKVVGLLGTGRQARRHLAALAAVLPLREARVYSRNPNNRRAFCQLMSTYLEMTVRPVEEPRDAVDGADVIVAATNSNVSVLSGEWLQPGAHLTSIVGSNAELVGQGSVRRKRRELDDATLARADVIVVTLRQQALQDQQGDIYDPVQAGIITWDKVHELSELVAGAVPGRTEARQITLFKQNSDQGVGYTALAAAVYRAARRARVGQEIRAWSP